MVEDEIDEKAKIALASFLEGLGNIFSGKQKLIVTKTSRNLDGVDTTTTTYEVK